MCYTDRESAQQSLAFLRPSIGQIAVLVVATYWNSQKLLARNPKVVGFLIRFIVRSKHRAE